MSIPRFHRVGKVKLEFTRREKGQYVNGRWEEGTPSKICRWVNVQPATNDETSILKEADRTRNTLKLFSSDTCDLRIKTEGDDGHDADTFVWHGDTYELMKVYNYEMGVLDHWRAYACLVPRANN